VDETIKKARRRYWVLRHLKKHGMNQEELVQVYASLVRSVIEFTSVVYGPMLNQDQEDRLEKLQGQSLKIVFGFDKSYRQVLELSGLETLKERRKSAIEKFARKCLDGEYGHWFPRNPANRQNRRTKKYKEEFARCERMKCTPIFHMRRVLNELEDQSKP
jgi:hypothetical protein